jgi:hypothetical protein
MTSGPQRTTRRSFLRASATITAIVASGSAKQAFSAPLPGSDGATLQAHIAGTVVTRDAPDYETWRRSMIWQYAKAGRKPDMIVQVDTVDDVIAAVNFARAHRMKVTTRGGGHSMAACFMRDGGMLIDVSRLDGIVVDKAKKRASVGPGVICSALAERLRQDGLAFPTAHCGTVPISGYLLGGGVGLNTSQWSNGMSVYAVKGVDIITPDGKLRHASTTENSDLFWAARGGGPGLFGVVVRFELECFDAPGLIFGATYTFRYSDFLDVAKAVDEIMPKLRKDVEILYFSTKGPDELVGKCKGPACDQVVYVDANAFVANKEEGRNRLAALTNHPIIARAIAKEENREGSFDRYFSDNELSFAQTRWMGDDVWIDDPVAATEILLRHIPDCPSPHGTPLLLYIGTHDQPDAACKAMGRYYLAYYLEWENDDEEAANRAYALRVFKDLKSVAKGSYINEMNQEGRPEDIATCYTPEAWKRLAELRVKWDPGQLFQGFYGQT